MGWLAGSGVNAGTVVPVQVSVSCSRPVPTKAFESQTYGGRPVNQPAPPRRSSGRCPSGSKLNPTRGDQSTFPLGKSAVLIGRKGFAASAGFWAGLSLNGTSIRRPAVNVSRSRRRPFVLRVETKLLHLEVGDRTIRARRGGQHPLERRGRTGLEAIEAVEGPDADLRLEERIVEAVELVGGTDRDSMRAGAEREVVLDREDVLVEGIELREPLGARREECACRTDLARPDQNERGVAREIALVAHGGKAGEELVGDPRPKSVVHLSRARIGLVLQDVTAVRQLVSIAQASRDSGAGRQTNEDVAIGIHVVEAQLHLAEPGELPAELAEQIHVGVRQLGR